MTNKDVVEEVLEMVLKKCGSAEDVVKVLTAATILGVTPLLQRGGEGIAAKIGDVRLNVEKIQEDISVDVRSVH